MNDIKIPVSLVIVLTVLTIIVGILIGLVLESNYRTNLSLRGYKAVATYETNSVGEITIDKTEWIKR